MKTRYVSSEVTVPIRHESRDVGELTLCATFSVASESPRWSGTAGEGHPGSDEVLLETIDDLDDAILTLRTSLGLSRLTRDEAYELIAGSVEEALESTLGERILEKST